jgi:hypothetical protein
MTTDLYWLHPLLQHSLAPLAAALTRLSHPDNHTHIRTLFDNNSTGTSAPPSSLLHLPLHPSPLASLALYRRLWLAIASTALCIYDAPCLDHADVVIPIALHQAVAAASGTQAGAHKASLLQTVLAKIRKPQPQQQQQSPSPSPSPSLLSLYSPFLHLADSSLLAQRVVALHTPPLSFEAYNDRGQCLSLQQELTHACMAQRLLQVTVHTPSDTHKRKKTSAALSADHPGTAASDYALESYRGLDAPLPPHKAAILDEIRLRLSRGAFARSVAKDHGALRLHRRRRGCWYRCRRLSPRWRVPRAPAAPARGAGQGEPLL